jgi:hypothetical protein
MQCICRRCNRITKQNLFRVTTEVLNILVCSSCARLAKELGLPTVKIETGKTADKIRRGSFMPNMKPFPQP